MDSTAFASRGKASVLPEHPRKGIFVDHRARQYACRVGYDINDAGDRVRCYQRLTADVDEATLRHIQLERDWDALKERWPQMRHDVRFMLPDELADRVDVSKPFWLRKEWEQTQRTENAAGLVGAVEVFKELLKKEDADLLPPDLRARLLQVLQPAANEVQSIASEAKRMTIREAADAFGRWKKAKVGLPRSGRKRGDGITASTYLTTVGILDDALKLLGDDVHRDLSVLSRERLERLIDDAYRSAKSPRTAFNQIRGSFIPFIQWVDRNTEIAYRLPPDATDLFTLRRPETRVKVGYTPEVVEKLKLIRAASAQVVKKGGEDVWLFVLLALNTGAYQHDIATWTRDNLKVEKDGTVWLWWQRRKTLCHNSETVWIRTDIWPELWALMKPRLAPEDPKINPQRLLFMGTTGRALYHVHADEGKTDAIGIRYRRACSKAKKDGKPVKVDLPFLMLRKIAGNAVKVHSGGNDDTVRKFLGHVQEGMLRSYLVQDFADVGTALGKWREQLLADGLLSKLEKPKS